MACLISCSYSDDSYTLQCFDLLFPGSDIAMHTERTDSGNNRHSMLSHPCKHTYTHRQINIVLSSVVNKHNRTACEPSLVRL